MDERIVLIRNSDRNTLSEFRFELFPPLNFGFEEYEVALQSFMCPISWDTITERECEFEYYPGHSDPDQPIIFQTAKIHIGRYNDMESLIKAMRKALPDTAKENIIIDILPAVRKCIIKVKNNAQVSFLHSDLGEVLGFGRIVIAKTAVKSHTYIGHFEYNLDRIDSLFVYCNVIKPTRVGGFMSQLLAEIPVINKRERILFANYHRLNYFPVIHRYISHIDIKIKDCTGSRIRFNGGNIFLQLKFRKKQ
jgi:hypothetical protein